MSETNKVFKGIKSQTVLTIILGVLQLLYFSIMSRILSQEDFGYFAIITAVTTVLSGIAEAGLGASVIQKKNASKDYISTAFTLSLIIGLTFMLILFVFSSWFSAFMIGSDKLETAFKIMSVTLLLCSVNSVGRATFMRRLDFMKFGLYQVIAYLLSSSTGIYLAYIGYGFYAIIAAVIINYLFITGLTFFFNDYYPQIKLCKEHIYGILSFGGWLTGSTIVRNITGQIDKFMMTRWISVADLGAYNRPAGFISTITDQSNSIFDTILFPILSNIQDDKVKIATSYRKSVSLMFVFSLFFCYGVVLSSDLIITIFFGKDWLTIASIFNIIAFTIIFMCYGRIADCYFRSLGEVKSYFVRRVIVCIITIISLYIGCQFGILGVAISVLVTRILDAIFRWVFLINKININHLSLLLSLFRISIVPSIAFVVCLFFKNNMPYGGVFSVFVFYGVLTVIGFLKPKLFGSVFYSDLYLRVKNKGLELFKK